MDREIQAQFTLRAPTFEKSASWIADPGLLAAFLGLCRAPRDARLLDVCCGTGIVGGAFRGRMGRLVGLDLTEKMLEQARQKLDTCHQGSAYALPFPDASFDVVVCRETWHLMDEPARAVAEMARVLSPGGQLIYGHIVPYGPGDADWMEQVFRKKQPLARHFFLEQDLRRLMHEAGLGNFTQTDYHLWESIDLWIDTPETPPTVREEIRQLFRNVSPGIAQVHPCEVSSTGEVRDCWRWVVLSGVKAAAAASR